VEVCKAKRIHMATCIWPPWAIASFGIMVNPLLDHNPAAVALLAAVRSNASDARSLPSLRPTIVIGDNNTVVRQIVRQSLLNSELFVSSLTATNYAGDRSCQIPPAISAHRGWPLGNNVQLGIFLHTLIPTYTGQINVVTYKGQNAADCSCIPGTCGLGCTCLCDTCMLNYSDDCPCGGEGDAPFCSCTCRGHHGEEESHVEQ
jgi:hypothetical protein